MLVSVLVAMKDTSKDELDEYLNKVESVDEIMTSEVKNETRQDHKIVRISLRKFPANSNLCTQFAFSQSSGLMNLTGHLVIIKDILIFIAIYIIIESSCQHPLD